VARRGARRGGIADISRERRSRTRRRRRRRRKGSSHEPRSTARAATIKDADKDDKNIEPRSVCAESQRSKIVSTPRNRENWGNCK